MQLPSEAADALDRWAESGKQVLSLGTVVAEAVLSTEIDQALLTSRAFGVLRIDSEPSIHGVSDPGTAELIDLAADQLVDDWLEDASIVADALAGDESREARRQFEALLAGTSEIAARLAVAEGPGASVSSNLTVPPEHGWMLARPADRVSRSVVFDWGLGAESFVPTESQLADVVDGYILEIRGELVAGGQAAVLEKVEASLEEIELAFAKESIALAENGLAHLTAPGFLRGVDAAFGIEVAASFDGVLRTLSGLFNTLKRQVMKALKWVTERVLGALPKPIREKVEKFFSDKVKDLIEDLPATFGRAAANVFGRDDTIARWEAADDDQRVAAEEKLGTVMKAHLKSIGWVTKIRGLTEEGVAAALVASALAMQPQLELVYLIAVVAGLAWVTYQLADAVDDVLDLV